MISLFTRRRVTCQTLCMSKDNWNLLFIYLTRPYLVRPMPEDQVQVQMPVRRYRKRLTTALVHTLVHMVFSNAYTMRNDRNYFSGLNRRMSEKLTLSELYFR